VYLAAGAPELDELAARAAGAGASVFRVERQRLERCLSTVTPRPAAAVATRPEVPTDVLATATSVLVLVGVADPGNVGTLLRTAEAAGFGAVLCCDSAVDPFNPKAVRASAGAACSLPVITGRGSVQLLEELATLGYQRVATRAGAAATYLEADLRGRVALLLGNEAHGLPASLDASVDEVVRIPMAGEAESLNVAAAGAVLCFEVARQRCEVATP
jgi:TrmH family RNA methyltransferase